MDDNMQESNKDIIRNIKNLFEDDYLIIAGALEDIAKNLFIIEKTVSEIDISVIVNDGYIVLRFIYDGEKYEPFKNKELLEQQHIIDLNKLEHYFDYYRMFDMNFAYVKLFKNWTLRKSSIKLLFFFDFYNLNKIDLWNFIKKIYII